MNGNFVSVGTPLKRLPNAFMYSKATSPGQCKLFYAVKLPVDVNPEFVTDDQGNKCIDILMAFKLNYSLTGRNKISVETTDIWTSDLGVASFSALATSSPQTAEYVCDKILNTCEDYSLPTTRKLSTTQKVLRKNGRILSRIKMRKCLRKFHDLPDLTYPPDGTIISYADGDSKACRALHSYMSTLNRDHCPHISFEREVDVNGKYKCSESAFVDPDSLFTTEELEFVELIGVNTFGYSEDSPGGRILDGACP